MTGDLADRLVVSSWRILSQRALQNHLLSYFMKKLTNSHESSDLIINRGNESILSLHSFVLLARTLCHFQNNKILSSFPNSEFVKNRFFFLFFENFCASILCSLVTPLSILLPFLFPFPPHVELLPNFPFSKNVTIKGADIRNLGPTNVNWQVSSAHLSSKSQKTPSR